ncbi:hypothetical protein HYC85_001568, partial [Camellia sinensis]
LLGDDFVIGDARVADEYINRFWLGLSLPKSLVSDTGYFEFANKFRGPGKDLSPISVKMIRSARFPVALMPVLKQIGVTDIQSVLCAHTCCLLPKWYLSDALFCLVGIPRGLAGELLSIGMVRWMLVESCRPNWGYVERLMDDLSRRLDDDALLLTE